MGWRSWLFLGTTVLTVHWWVLGAAIPPLQVRRAPAMPTFITRSLATGPSEARVSLAVDESAEREPVGLPVPPAPAPRAPTPARKLNPVAPEVPQPPPAADAQPAIAALANAPREPAHAVAAAPAQRFSIPASATWHYQVTASVRQFTLQGQAELQWQHDGTSYDARLEISSPLLPRRVQHSAGLLTAEGLAPVRFSDKVRSEEAAHFQRDQGRVIFSSNRPDAPLLPGTQDRLSVILQLGAMLAGAPAQFPPGTVISIPTAGTRDAEAWQFTVEGPQELDLPGGKVAAIKLIRNPRREFDQKVELWLATGMDFVPVRLRITQANGDWVDQQWSSTDGR
jgi:hypothetical protein